MNGRGEPRDPDLLDEIDAFLDEIGFDQERSVLTRRQAQVLALRDRGESQATIAELFGSSRANVSSIEASGRENIERARETVAFADALHAPVRVHIPTGTDLYDVPQQVFEACDEAGVKVSYTAPNLMKIVSDEAGDAVSGRQVAAELIVGVTASGDVQVRQSE